MLPNKFVILWNDKPIGIEDGYPSKSEYPGNVFYFHNREAAENYRSKFITSPSYKFYDYSRVVEIQFRIVG